jgi:hypothetical protein
MYYLALSCGVSWSFHYCMGQVKSMTLIGVYDEAACCGETEADGCCSDTHHFVKLKDDQHKSWSGAWRLIQPAAVTPTLVTYFADVSNGSNCSVGLLVHDPPDPESVPLFLLHDNWRI